MNKEGLPQQVIDFYDKNSHLEISMEEFFLNYTNKTKSHNHTVENLFLYFNLLYHLEKDRVAFYRGGLFIADNRKHKFFITDNSDFLSKFNFDDIKEIKKKFIFYSSNEQNISKELFVKSKLKEAFYSIDQIFNEETYFEKYKDRKRSEIKKKIYNKIIYPFRYLEKNKDLFEVRDLQENDLDTMEELHSKWVEFKQNDPKVFQMMFSSARYNRCIQMMYNHPFLKRDDFFCKIFYWDKKPIAIRQCLIKEIEGENISFDIGFFSIFSEVPSQLIFYINIWCLRELQQSYKVKKHNTGMTLDKNLEMSKGHFPFTPHYVYKYNLV